HAGGERPSRLAEERELGPEVLPAHLPPDNDQPGEHDRRREDASRHSMWFGPTRGGRKDRARGGGVRVALYKSRPGRRESEGFSAGEAAGSAGNDGALPLREQPLEELPRVVRSRHDRELRGGPALGDVLLEHVEEGAHGFLRLHDPRSEA